MKVIELTGLPKSGRTSIVNRVGSRLRAQGFSVKKINDDSGKSPINLHDVFFHEAWVAHRLIDKLQDSSNTKYDFVLVNRGLVDLIMTLLSLQKYKLLDLKKAKLAIQYYQQFIELQDFVVYLDITPKISLKRNKGRRGRLLNEKFLTILRRTYQKQFAKYTQHYITVDATRDLSVVANEVENIVASIVKQKR